MKKTLSVLLLSFIFFVGLNFAQQSVTIEEVQYQDSVSLLTNGDLPSPYNGQTVKLRGIVMVSPLVNPQTDRRPIVWAGTRWVTYLQDPDGQVYERFDGINVVQQDTTGANQGTFFDLVDTAQVVEITLTVAEFNNTTQGDVLLSPVTPVSIIQQLPKRPDPIELSITDFYDDSVLVLSEKYEGEYVIIRNVITSDRNTSNGTFRINDADGNYMYMYDQSGYFTLRTHRLTGLTTYQPPVDGTTLSYIRGLIQTRFTGTAVGYHIIPLYPGDIQVGVTPPSISTVKRNLPQVIMNQAVTISANVTDDGGVDSVKLFYRIDSGNYTPVNMTLGSGNNYSGTIPGVNSDSALVDYYIWSKDNDGNVSTMPAAISNVQYFYLVLDRNVTIQDVQYNPFGTDVSGYNGYRVPLTGVVTADTSDCTTSFALRIYIQNGEGPWSGIQVGTRGTNGSQIRGFQKGQLVTVNGLIWDDTGTPTFNVTRIDSTTSVQIISSGNPLPTPQVVQTNTIGTLGNGVVAKEQWESVLMRYNNVTVTNENADFPSNFGEMFVSDGSGDTRVELEDGRHDYHNLSDPTRLYYVKTGSTFDALQGVLYYSFGNYKLVPRNNNDFIGYNPVSVENEGTIPTEYVLSQNYPNPFNPSTKINFSLPFESNVRMSVFNILGQEVKVLVDSQVQPVGSYNLTFDARDLPSGIYFYRLTASSISEGRNFVDVKKMMLIK
ncbi:MAG: T9SS type A sorting domain-containing protein [Ignavibacteriaceae bacterium]|nr:T9SS type A sorting domain-containing protein [Ignavibacteriaceae bacterium]